MQSTTLYSLRYKSSQQSLSLLLTTHGATAASTTCLTPSSCGDEPLAEGSRGGEPREQGPVGITSPSPARAVGTPKIGKLH
ncbi:hypothetical protein Taro_013412 [Colocasia esculenta]|uniref:Uncharacterized protein n=1 Tax=Colocasia esculenta TaxID=4460 RepID=A0A843UBS2_COLES|nr:hypothetical protein [Colocasia esculenta]